MNLSSDFDLMNLKTTKYVNTPERIALRQEQIDAVNDMNKGVSLQVIAQKYPNWGPQLMKDYGLMNLSSDIDLMNLKPGCLSQDEMLARHYPDVWKAYKNGATIDAIKKKWPKVYKKYMD